MSNFRTPANILFSAILHKAHFSSGSNEVGQGLLKQVQDVVQHEVKSEKLRNLLPYINQANTALIPNKSTDTNQSEVFKEADQSNITEFSEISEQLSSQTEVENTIVCENDSGSKVGSEINVPPEDCQDPPKSLPVLVVAKAKTPYGDLTNISLPLPLHMRDTNNFLVDSVVQDIRHVYSKTSNTVDICYLSAKTQGKTLITSVEEIAKRPSAVQEIMRERVNKMNAIAVQGQKLDLFALDTDKIMKEVNKIIETMKNMFQKLFKSEQKPSVSKESKKEENPEKKEEKKETVK